MNVVHLAKRSFQILYGRETALEQFFPGSGKRDLSCCALEQAHRQSVLDTLYRLTHRGWSQPQPCSRCPKSDIILDRNRKDFRGLAKRFDIIFDASGAYTYGKCRRLLSDTGVFVTAAPSLSILFAKVLTLFSRQRVEMVMAQPKRSDLEKIAGWMAQGLRIPIAMQLPLAQASDALRALEKGKFVGKIVLEVRAD